MPEKQTFVENVKAYVAPEPPAPGYVDRGIKVVEDVASSISETAKSMYEKGKDVACDMYDKVSTQSADLTEKAKTNVGFGVDKACEAVESVKNGIIGEEKKDTNTANEIIDKSKDKVSEVAGKVKDEAYALKEKAQENAKVVSNDISK